MLLSHMGDRTRPLVASPDPVQLTDLFLDGLDQMDVVLRHQRDGDAVPPWSTIKNQHVGILKHLYKPRMKILL